MERLQEVRFEYYREEDAQKNEAGEWVEEWNAQEVRELPRAVRITVVAKHPLTILASLPAHRYEEMKTGLRPGGIPIR